MGFLAFVVLLALLPRSCSNNDRPSRSPGLVDTSTLNANISYRGGVLTLENRGLQIWTNCSLRFADTFTREIPAVPRGQRVTLQLDSIKDRKGKKYNPFMAAQTFEITCDTPSGRLSDAGQITMLGSSGY